MESACVHTEGCTEVQKKCSWHTRNSFVWVKNTGHSLLKILDFHYENWPDPSARLSCGRKGPRPDFWNTKFINLNAKFIIRNSSCLMQRRLDSVYGNDYWQQREWSGSQLKIQNGVKMEWNWSEMGYIDSILTFQCRFLLKQRPFSIEIRSREREIAHKCSEIIRLSQKVMILA